MFLRASSGGYAWWSTENLFHSFFKFKFIFFERLLSHIGHQTIITHRRSPPTPGTLKPSPVSSGSRQCGKQLAFTAYYISFSQPSFLWQKCYWDPAPGMIISLLINHQCSKIHCHSSCYWVWRELSPSAEGSSGWYYINPTPGERLQTQAGLQVGSSPTEAGSHQNQGRTTSQRLCMVSPRSWLGSTPHANKAF